MKFAAFIGYILFHRNLIKEVTSLIKFCWYERKKAWLAGTHLARNKIAAVKELIRNKINISF